MFPEWMKDQYRAAAVLAVLLFLALVIRRLL
jgi:hypothetical protein